MRNLRQRNRFRNLLSGRRRIVYGGLIDKSSTICDDEKAREGFGWRLMAEMEQASGYVPESKGFDPSENPISQEVQETTFNVLCSR